MKIEITRSLPETAWRQFVNGQPLGNIFHTPEMFRVMGHAQGYTPDLWAAVDPAGGVLVLFLPVLVTLNRRLRYLTSRAIAYGSVLCDPSEEGQQALALLLQTYSRHAGRDLLFTELRNLSDQGGIQSILQQHGFLFEEHLNYLINLEGQEEDILQGIGSRTRKNIRRGLNRQDVTIKEISERDELQAGYRLLKETYQAAKVPLAHPSLFDAAYEILVPRGMARFTLALVEQNPAAVSMDLIYKNVLYGWYGGMDRCYSSFMPTEMITWDTLRWGAENGYNWYDFGGAGKPEEESGVRRFKAKFGGKLVNYGRNILVHAPLRMALSHRMYELVRRFLF